MSEGTLTSPQQDGGGTWEGVCVRCSLHLIALGGTCVYPVPRSFAVHVPLKDKSTGA